MRQRKDNDEGQAFIGIIMMAAGLLTLVALFAIVPLLGYQLEQTTANIPCCENATGILTFSGNITDGEAVLIDDIIYEFDVAGDGITGDISVNTSAQANNDSACTAANALASEVNNNSVNVTAVANCTDQGNATVVLTSVYCSDEGNLVNIAYSCDNLSYSEGCGEDNLELILPCTLCGGSDGSEWCPTLDNMPSALSLWSTNAPLLSLIVTVSILVTIIGAIMAFAQPGRGGRGGTARY